MMVVRAMWDIGGRDKKVKLELNDRVRILVCTRAAGLIYLPMGRGQAVPFISNLLELVHIARATC